ncbi:MAG: DNA repair protein RecN [Treponema sp.]|jgi:DNA repair protein RecN (Recombination protein N)|nr:DNA repair protein RecN [Treponema sp.]
MLEELTIRNFALVDSISLSFRPGFNVLTGETGAGKSIIVGSLGFLMGGKTETDVIRSGCEEASVSAIVSISKGNGGAFEWLKSHEINSDEDTVIVRRNIKTSGRSSIYIQETPVTRTDLSGFMTLLFDLHGQHDHGSLLRKENHRLYLDRFAGIEDEVLAYGRVFSELAEKRKTLEASFSSQKDREARLEILRYAVDEISAAALRSGELRDLENEAQILSGFEKLAGRVNSAADSFFDGESSLVSLARRCRSALDSAASIDASLSVLQKRIEDLYYEADDIAGELRSYRDGLTYDPRRQQAVDERLALLYKLKRKYCDAAPGSPVPVETAPHPEDAILAYRAAAEAEIEALSNIEENRENIKAAIAALEKDVASGAAVLRQKRTAAAASLGQRITGILKRLGMPNARFSPSITPKTQTGQDGRSTVVCGPWGAEDVEFLISANTGEPLKDLSRIASGGELSRVMLAIKSVLSAAASAGGVASAGGASAGDVETLIFDEIDAGIGGEVALAVGEYLEKMGEARQIFCVTHLASIAVRAGNHFKVEKRTEQGRTFTGVGPLSADGRRREIARMLAGDGGEAALAHADDLIARYGSAKFGRGGG